jgi:DNA-binding NtrC family response regulator
MTGEPSSKTLLILEHQAVTREALAVVFRSEGYRVVTAANEQEALSYMHESPRPSVVIVGMRGAGDEGRHFLEARLSDASLATVPIVITTDGLADPKWLETPGVAGAFRKPVPLDPLLSLVRQCA